MNIIPAIIGKDFGEVEEKIDQVENYVGWVQIDIMDGLFVPNESWPFFDMKESPSDLEYVDFVRNDDLKTEIHLMTLHPGRYLDKWIEAGADRVYMHYESDTEKNLLAIMDELNNSEVEVGVALKLGTPIDVLDQFIDKLDAVLLMSIAEIGSQGHPFDERVFAKIKSLRAKYSGVTIGVDGGVNLENAGRLVSAGADNLNVGSAIFQSDNISETILKFKNVTSTRQQNKRA